MSKETKAPKADDVRCPDKKCQGILVSCSSPIAEALGILTLKCASCQKSWGFKGPCKSYGRRR